ncbi:MAG: hypothetical protein HGGPFJEG_00626 [Ignavibacteria bacterium]|nr:hypothetical protein [Ignavibacteria bacterium]
MKTLSIFFGPLLAISITLMTGCSDSLTSSSTLRDPKPAAETERGWDSYSSTILVKPQSFVFLDSTVTSLSWIAGYMISNCEITSRNLYITASNIDNNQSLPCNWKTNSSLMLKDLLIQNLTSRAIVIDVKLNGIGVE